MERTIAGIVVLTSLAAGGVDVSVLDETPVAIVETVKGETVTVEQKGNVVETTLPWKGEPGLTVTYDLGEPTAKERLEDKRKHAVVTEVVPVKGGEGFKVDILLNERPDTDCLEWGIGGWEQYRFSKVKPITQRQIDAGWRQDPESIGSYSVYHSKLANHAVGGINYENGKFAHIDYPKVWEVGNPEGTTQRAESFLIENGLMRVCPGAKFLDEATYPVRIDPTFGYTSIGAEKLFLAEKYNNGAGFDYEGGLGGNPVTGITGDVVSIHAYTTNELNQVSTEGTVDLFGVLYEGDTLFLDLLGSKESVAEDAGPEWKTFTFDTPVAVTASDVLWPGVFADPSTFEVPATDEFYDVYVYGDQLPSDEFIVAPNTTNTELGEATAPPDPMELNVYGQYQTPPAWALLTNYTEGNVVLHNGIYYLCGSDHIATVFDEPGVGDDWSLYWFETSQPRYSVYATYTESAGGGASIDNTTFMLLE